MFIFTESVFSLLLRQVLSDKSKRTVYDAGLFGLVGENDDEVSFLNYFLLF